MYIKDLRFKDADNNIMTGKVIECSKLKKVLNKISKDYLLNVNEMTGNINVMNKYCVQIGFIDVVEERYEEFSF